MMGLIHPMVAACLMCGMFLALPARAESGRITFSGAVVVPTCAVPVEAAAGTGGGITGGHAFVCAGRSQAERHADVSIYRLSVVHLDDAATVGSPLLRYFVGYRASMNAVDAQMVTRTYE